MIVVASLYCDRKKSSWMVGVPAILAQDYQSDWIFYMNIEGDPSLDTPMSEYMKSYEELIGTVAASGRPYAFDYWTYHSSWWKRPTYDQDQARLTPIVYGRNMALNYARAVGAQGILFVDADVIIPPHTITTLSTCGKPFVGGVVPGRGIHRNLRYIFWETDIREGPLTKCAHGTDGCLYIDKSIFNYLSFRWGPAIKAGTMLSEDPAYANDAEVIFGTEFWIHNGVQCQHWDDPEHPLTQEGVAGF